MKRTIEYRVELNPNSKAPFIVFRSADRDWLREVYSAWLCELNEHSVNPTTDIWKMITQKHPELLKSSRWTESSKTNYTDNTTLSALAGVVHKISGSTGDWTEKQFKNAQFLHTIMDTLKMDTPNWNPKISVPEIEYVKVKSFEAKKGNIASNLFSFYTD
jgi:hypothetical protein